MNKVILGRFGVAWLLLCAFMLFSEGEAFAQQGVADAPAAANPPTLDEAADELPTVPAAVNPQEQLPLGPQSSDEANVIPRTSDAPTGGWVMNTLAALGVVIGLVFAARWAARKWGGLRGGGVRVNASPIVEVLSRTSVAPRNHVVLLRVGSRILVVNDGTAGMRTLATVEDPDEVAGLLQSVETARETSLSNSFGRAMSKLSNQWSAVDRDDDLGGDDSESGIDQVRGTLTGLRDRLRLTTPAGTAGTSDLAQGDAR